MRTIKSIFLFSLLTIFLLAQNVSNYMDQGGAIWHIAGELEVESGGVIDVESGGALKIAGTAITSTAAELNILDGCTATFTELNLIDGVTATTAELNILDGCTATFTELNLTDGVTATTAELNIMDGVTSTFTELNYLDGGLARTNMVEDALAVYGIPTYEIRAADLADMGIAETAGDHYLVLGTNVITLVSEIANNETETAISYFMFVLPPEYVAAGDVKIRLKHTVAGAGTSNASTVDFSVYEQDGNGAVGGDLVTTTAIEQTEDSWVTSDFVVTATTLVAGDILIVKFTSATIENAVDVLQASFDGFAVLLDIKG